MADGMFMVDDGQIHSGIMTNVEDIRRFVTAGKATLTLRSKVTGKHYTYRVQTKENGQISFVSVLAGEEYQYAGVLQFGSFRLTKASRLTWKSPAANAFYLFSRCIFVHGQIHKDLEVWHDGHCSKCGRQLTDPQSIARGIGPVCFGNMGG